MTSIQETIREADELYSKRERIENVRAVTEILQNASLRVIRSYDIDWRLGRAFFFLGQQAENGDQSLSYHSQGIVSCERALVVKQDEVEAPFWLGVNLALCAGLENPFAGIRHALRARRELERAVHLDSSYHAAGPLRVLARLQHKLPLYLGGRKSRAQKNYQEAIAIAPENTVTRVYFAELLLELGEKQQACLHLEEVLNAPYDPQWTFETQRDQQIAKEILAKLHHLV